MMTDKQWRDQTRRLWAKHKRAGVLMMRPRNKERITKKWINVYMRTLHWIPDPETCIMTDKADDIIDEVLAQNESMKRGE
jgi:hypothetical protein